MYKIKYSFVIALVLFSYSILSSQTVQKSTITKAAAKCKWVGTVRTTYKSAGAIETLGGTVIYESDPTSSFPEWEYILTGGNLTWSASGTTATGCVVTVWPLTFEIVPSIPEVTGALIFSVYYGGSGVFLRILNERVTITCPDRPIEYGIPSVYGFQIGGREEDTIWRNGVISGSIEQSAGGFTYSREWDLHQEGVDTKLIVESDEYDDWLPTALNNEKEPAKPITFSAMLLEADGTTACATADSFKFELINVSNEPGIALNFPDENKAEEDWDMHFIHEFNNPTDVMSSNRLSLITEGGTEAVVSIPSFDWGAYGKLKVSAFMPGGKIITGFLKGHPEITEIPIPKRSGTSKIADKWKKDNEVTALDDDDAENKPVGDGLVEGHVGDGFTLYEEYRGFYENGEHIFGDPKNKDLFIYKELDDFIPGIELFAFLTELKVHYKLNTSEFDTKKRMMNFNYLDAPHQTDQHGLFLVKNDSVSNSFIGPPKYSDTVNISAGAFIFTTFIEGSSREITNELSSTVAHELGHSVRIQHHGGMDQKKNKYSSVRDLTNMYEFNIIENDSRVIDPRWENDSTYSQAFNGKRYIGVWGGQHSGVEDCIMRYDCAFGNIPGPGMTGNIRYITNQERTGIILCEIKDGTGVNDNNRSPRPRYGPATNGRCKFQICVNDKYH